MAARCLCTDPGISDGPSMSKPAIKTELPRYVGYAEIAEETGIERHTIQRLMKAGKFPKPDLLPTKENKWRVTVINSWLEQRNAEQISRLNERAKSDPAKLKPDQLVDAHRALAARLAEAQGIKVEPDAILGFTYQLTDEQRLAVANDAAAQQRQLITGIVDRLDGLHFVEALILQRAFLPPLRRFADEALVHIGIQISMSDDEWREAGLLIVDRVINGEAFEPNTHPREVMDALVDDGVLSRGR